MGYRYVVIGSGRQGTAAAYDLARFGEAESIVMADLDKSRADSAAARINRLIGRDMARSIQLDASDYPALVSVLQGAHVALSAVTYYFNLGLTRTCIEAGASLCDTGGNQEVVWAQLKLDEAAKQAGVSVLPDCGGAGPDQQPGRLRHGGPRQTPRSLPVRWRAAQKSHPALELSLHLPPEWPDE